MREANRLPEPGTAEYRQLVRQDMEQSLRAWHMFHRMATGESQLEAISDRARAEELMWLHASSVAGSMAELTSDPEGPPLLLVPHLPELLAFLQEELLEALDGQPSRVFAERSGNRRATRELNALLVAQTYEQLADKKLPSDQRLIPDDDPIDTVSAAFSISRDAYRKAKGSLGEVDRRVEYYWHCGAFRARLADMDPDQRLDYARAFIKDVGRAYRRSDAIRQPGKRDRSGN